MKNLEPLLLLFFTTITFITLTTPITTSATKLYSVCQRNAHCSRLIANSFCGWNDLNDQQTVCMCRDGYKATEDESGCVARHHCSFAGFNAVQQTGFECPSGRQFCRRNVCLCRLGYDYDHLDHCVPNEDSILLEEMASSSNGSSSSLKGGVFRSPPMMGGSPMRGDGLEVEETLNLSFVLYVGTVFLVVSVILTIFSSIAAIVFFRKFHQLKMQLYSQVTTTTEQKLLSNL